MARKKIEKEISLDLFHETIPEEYKGVTQKRVDKRGHKIEVLLSEYLI